MIVNNTDDKVDGGTGLWLANLVRQLCVEARMQVLIFSYICNRILKYFFCRWCPAADLCADTNTLDPDWEVRMCHHNNIGGDSGTVPKLCPSVDTKFELSEKELGQLEGRKDGKMYYNLEVEHEGDEKNRTIYEKYFLDFSKLPSEKVISFSGSDKFLESRNHHLLPFIFPYFGHPIQNIEISPQGYIHIPDQKRLLKQKSKMQYIAPYWTGWAQNISVSVYEQESAITISWSYPDNFEFQLFLDYSGKIGFIYSGKKSNYPSGDLTIGLSDSFFYYKEDPTHQKLKHLLEYNYHMLNLSSEVSKLSPRSGLVLTPLSTCNTASTCADCTTMVSIV